MALEINSTLRLPQTEFFNNRVEKTGICIHHTVGGTAESTFNWWNSDSSMVGTAYIIDRDGTLYEVFDPECWAWQFGLRWADEDRIAFEKRFIGIELASEGGLLEESGKYYCFDRISSRTEKPREEAFDVGSSYRGYKYFDRYEPEQVDTLVELVNNLCDQFHIPRKVKADPTQYYGEGVKDFEGIIGHVMVRKDKSDPAPIPEFWERLKSDCNLQSDEDNDLSAPDEISNKKMSEREITELFNQNVLELNKMHIPAGSMVKGLIMELSRKNRNTYIKLRDAEAGGHVIFYDFMEGDKGLVKRIGLALGFKKVTAIKLEVHNA
jgi:hypothetical protein